MWPRSNAAGPRAAADAGLDAGLRAQIRGSADLSRLVRELGFDPEVAERARALVAALKASVRVEVDDVPALQAAVAAARSQAKGDAGFEQADRDLLDAIAAAGADRTRILELLGRDPIGVQLPLVERIPLVRNGVVSWRTPVDQALVRRGPTDRTGFEQRLAGIDALFASRHGPHREGLRQQVLEATESARRDVRREKTYVTTALQFLDRSVEALLTAGAVPSAPARFTQLLQVLRRLSDAEARADTADPADARTVTALASEVAAAGWLHVPTLTRRIAALLLAPPYVSASGWFRRRRSLRVLGLLRQEIAESHYDVSEVVRRLQQLEAKGAFFSSLVYPLLRAAPAPKARAVSRGR